MKTFRIFHPFAAAALFVAAVASIPSSAPAQNSPAAPAPNAQATPAESGTIDVNFEGVTVGEIVGYVRDKYKETNIVLGPGAADVTVSELKLHAVDVPTLLEAIRLAADRPLTVNTLFESSSKGWYLGLVNNAPRFPEQPEIAVFNLSGYFALQNKQEPDFQKAADDLTVIIDNTVASFHDYEAVTNRGKPVDAAPPKYLFHKGANLLVVIGTPQAVEIARKVLDALPGSIPNPTSSTPVPAAPRNF